MIEIEKSTFTNCVLVGPDIPAPPDGSDGVIRIGRGDTYLEIADGKTTIVGADSEVARGVLEAIDFLLAQACGLNAQLRLMP